MWLFCAILVSGLAETSSIGETFIWTRYSGGAYQTPTNWAPNGVPGDDDVAVITISNTAPSVFTIGFANDASALRLNVFSVDVTWNLNGHKFILGSFNTSPVSFFGPSSGSKSQTRLTIDNGRFEVIDPIMIGNGADEPTEVRVTNTGDIRCNLGCVMTLGSVAGADGRLTIDGGIASVGDIIIGSEGAGRVAVLNGGRLQTRDVFIARDNAFPFREAQGSFVVMGHNSVWTVGGTVSVGAGGTAEIIVAQGGAVVPLPLTPGYDLVIRRSTASPFSQIDLSVDGGTMRLGNGSLTSDGGKIAISNGGKVQTSTTALGGVIDLANTITLSDAGSEWTNSGSFYVGGTQSSAGIFTSLSAERGATLSVGGTLKVWNQGTLNLNGAVINAGSLELVPGSTFNWSTGTLNLTNNGLIVDTGGLLGATVEIGAEKVLSATDIYVSGNSGASGGTGALTAQTGGAVSAGNTLKVWPQGTVTVLGGKVVVGGIVGSAEADSLEVGTSGTVNLAGGTINAKNLRLAGGILSGSGVVNAQVFGGSMIAAAGGTLTLGDAASTTGFVFDGTLNVDTSMVILRDRNFAALGRTTMLAGGVLVAENGMLLGEEDELSGFGSVNGRIAGGLGSTIMARGGILSLGEPTSFLGFVHQGVLDVAGEAVTLRSAGFAQLGALTTIGGGSLDTTDGVTTGGLALGAGDVLTGHGTVTSKVAGDIGSTIQVSGGALSLGALSAYDGFATDGNLVIGGNAVVLSDQNQAALGALTLIGTGDANGTLTASNGISVDFAEAILGRGNINTANDALRPTMINGHVRGLNTTNRIVFNGYVKGVGTFTNVTFTGTHSPGFSPTTLSVGDVEYADIATLVIELAGTAPGAGFDQINSTSVLNLGGTLDVDLINGFIASAGQSFNILTATDSIVGTFDTTLFPALDSGLAMQVTYTSNSVTLRIVSALNGDYNGDGIVDAADYVVWRKTDGTQQGYNSWRANFGQTAGSGSMVDAAVPEPASLVLLLVAFSTVQLIAANLARSARATTDEMSRSPFRR
jgi:T5SS/PEP-CTERM-associated repeat protein